MSWEAAIPGTSISEGLVLLGVGVGVLYLLAQKGIVSVDRQRIGRDRRRAQAKLQQWTASPWSVKKALVFLAAILAVLFAVGNPPVLLMLLAFGWLYYRPGREQSLESASRPPAGPASPPPTPSPSPAARGPQSNRPFPVRPGFRRPFPERMWMRRQRPSFFRRTVRFVGVLLIVALGATSLAFLCGEWPKHFAAEESPRFARRLAEIFEEPGDDDSVEADENWRKSYLVKDAASPGGSVRRKVEARLKASLERAGKKISDAAIRPVPAAAPLNAEEQRRIRLAKEAREASGEPPKAMDVDGPDAELLAHPRLILRSNPWPAEADGVQEIVEKVVALLPRAVEVRDETAKLEGWTPSARWVRTQLLSAPKSLPDEPGRDGTKLLRVEMELSLLPKDLDAVYKRFRADRSSERTFLLAKTYAGSVLILGGLAIVTRLGTGRRRTEANQA